MDHRIDVRREPLPELVDLGHDEALLARIHAEIERDGPMTFARFMELALYDPDGGYYRSAEARPGRGGDFLTAPELHPIFGHTLARALDEVWQHLGRPAPFVVREHGAGTGALAAAVLGGLAADASPLLDAIRWEPVEVDPRRIAAFRERLAGEGFAARIGDPESQAIDGVVLANEVLDALPVHRVRQRGGRLMEVAVIAAGDGLGEVEIEPTTPALARRLAEEGVELVDGQTAEICLALDGWIAEAAAPLRRGLLLLIDYGAPAADLYDPIRRRDGTLMAYSRHRAHGDPYRAVGRQDLTAHVDVTAVERAANAVRLETVGITTQAEALVGLGIEDRLRAVQAAPSTSFEEYTALRSALARLLDPAAMGRFRVMAFGRAWPPDPAGAPLGLFSFRLPERRRPASRPTTSATD